MVSDTGLTNSSAKIRSQWEAKVRAAKSIKVNLKLPSWFQENNKLWEVNKLVKTDISSLGINEILLITGVHFEMGAKGSGCTLELQGRDSYIPEEKVNNSVNLKKIYEDSAR